MADPDDILDAAEADSASLEVHRLRRALAEARAGRRRAEDVILRNEERLRLALAISKPRRPKPIKPKRRRKREAVAVAVASDWHIEEGVDPATVDGMNAYGLDESERRAREFFQGVLWLVEHHSRGMAIDTLVLALLGDLITGQIHPELAEVGELGPARAIQRVQRYVMEGIDLLLAKTKLSLVVPCCYGNHGRITEKRRISTGRDHSLEWLLYHSLAQAYAREPRVRFEVADGALLYMDLLGWRVRFTHGDSVRYRGGIGGLLIPLLKKIHRWDTHRQAAITVLGHFHQLVFHPKACVNGSLIGHTPYSIEIGAELEPPRQAFFLVDRKRGPTAFHGIWVGEARAHE